MFVWRFFVENMDRAGMFMQTYAYHNTWNSFPKSSLLKQWVMLGYFLAPYVHSDAGLQVTGVGGGRHFFLLGITMVMSLHFGVTL